MTTTVPRFGSLLRAGARRTGMRTRRFERVFWVVSLIIALTDGLFVYVNYRDTQQVLYKTLAAEAAQHESAFALNLRSLGLHMQQMAAYLANLSEVRDLFLRGYLAVKDEGGGGGGSQAAAVRQRLFELVAPGWRKSASDYQMRLLHFHLGPGDVSFLRVHEPTRFGDDLSQIRHSITHAISNDMPTHGFESGRVDAGVRGVVPISATLPGRSMPQVIGALEAGSSFGQLLRVLESGTHAAYSVLMTTEHLYDTRWPDLAAKQVRKRPLLGDWFIEATSDESLLREILADPAVAAKLGAREPIVARVGETDYAVYGFPFRDFENALDPAQPAVGVVVTWHDATAAIAAAENTLITNVLLGAFGFLLVESLLFVAWTLARTRLQRIIDERTEALSDTNYALQKEVSLRMQSEHKLRNHQEHLEHQVSLRTNSLRESVVALEHEMETRKAAELALQRERDQAQITLRSIIDGVITTDEHCRVVYLNPAAQDLTGWSQRQAEGRPLAEVFNARDMESGGEPVDFQPADDARAGRQHGENTELTRRDGDVVTVEHSVSPIRDENGRNLGVVLVFHDDTEARELAVQLSYHASHDALTGLLNRRAIEVELAEALRDSRKEGSCHAFLYIDLDQFKVVNDTCGHVAGDELLRQLSKLLQQSTRKNDTLGRLGGDEFGLLLRHCPLTKAQGIAEHLLQTLRTFRFVWHEKTFRVGASIGVATIEAESENIEAVLSAADSACYLAKDKGRSRVQLWLPDDGELTHRRGEMQWVSRIQHALSENRFVLFGQPIVPLNASGSAHQEILVRMLDEHGELILPTAFIPAAERYGLMGDVDRWVIDRALQMLRQQQNAWPRVTPLMLSINLSGETMADEGILAFIRDRIAAYRVDPRHLCFEVTETAAIANLARAIDLIGELKQDGCRFALDDFGSGLSSFGYLKALPVDYLKIDGSFVRNLDREPVDRVMVKAINEVGHAMQLKTIAEFVENQHIAEELRQMGVDYAQGYGIGQPMALVDKVAVSR